MLQLYPPVLANHVAVGIVERIASQNSVLRNWRNQWQELGLATRRVPILHTLLREFDARGNDRKRLLADVRHAISNAHDIYAAAYNRWSSSLQCHDKWVFSANGPLVSGAQRTQGSQPAANSQFFSALRTQRISPNGRML